MNVEENVEELIASVDWEKVKQRLPVIVQHAETKDVLMVAYMNQEAVTKTYADKKVTFYSRSKQRIWQKGETSGHFLEFISASLDCDQDALLIKAKPHGPTCHTGTTSCFGERDPADINFLTELENIIADRKERHDSESYTSQLFAKGLNKIAQKVGEESVETIIAATNEDQAALKAEAADLIYHLLVLLAARDMSLSDVVKELQSRHR